jgi:hypothetical protein
VLSWFRGALATPRSGPSRDRAGDGAEDGSITILAAVSFPLVLLCVALALATIVWSSSEHETQRAADAAAVRAAATAFLGTDFPYQQLPGVTSPLTYPDVVAISAWAGVPAPAPLAQCGTVGVPPVAAGFPGVGGVSFGGGTLVAPAGCSGVGPYPVEPPLGDTDQSRTVACRTAEDAMAPAPAPYANRFHEGSGGTQPKCSADPDGTRRINVKLATGSPLVGFGQTAANAATGALQTQVVPGAGSVAQALAAFGVHLDTSLPSLICPEVAVTVDQPVREPVFDRKAAPNGRATARRIVKNAVIVPVYEGKAVTGAASGSVSASSSGVGVDMTTSTGTTVHIPPQNLNAVLLAQQQQLLTLLDEMDAVIDSVVRASHVTLDQLNGVYSGIDPTAPQPPSTPGAAPLDGLRLTKCLRDTMAQIYDPPSGDAPTSQEVLAAASQSGEEVLAVQVGAVRTACTDPGAIPAIPTATGTQNCLRVATTPTLNTLTGLYEVPFFDVTPVLVQDVGNGNFESVPVHSSQASGAFRGGLVRDAADDRYDPDVRQPRPTPTCQAAVPAPTPTTACAVLSYSPSPLPTVSPPSVSLPVSPPPTTLPTLPLPTSVSPTPTPTPTPTATPTPTPSPTLCVGLLCPTAPP